MAVTQKEISLKVHSLVSESLKFSSIQRKFMNELIELFNIDPIPFTSSIENILLQLLPQYKKHPNAERGLRFVSALFEEMRKEVSSFESDEKSQYTMNSMTHILLLLIEGLKSREKACREGSIWLIHKIFTLNIHQTLDFPQELYQNITASIKNMLKDKCTSIRTLAINIAQKLNVEQDILKINLNEPNKENRKNTIILTEKLEDLLKITVKIFDVEPEVRIAALVKIQEIDMKLFEIGIRREILFLVKRDRSEKVRKIAFEAVSKYKNSYGLENLLYMMEIETLDIKQQKEFMTCLEYIITEMGIDEVKDLVQESLLQKLMQKDIRISDLILARVSIEFLRSRNEEILYTILPTQDLIHLISFSHQIFPYCYTQNILKIITCLDLGDEEIRKTLVVVLTKLCFTYPIVFPEVSFEKSYFSLFNPYYFASNSLEILQEIVKLLKNLLDQNPNEFSRIMSEIINEIREPLNLTEEDEKIIVFVEDTQRTPSLFDKKSILEKKLNRIEEEIDAYESEKESLIQKDQYAEALKVKAEISNKHKEAESVSKKIHEVEKVLIENLSRSLILTIEMLKGLRHGLMHFDILDLVKSLVSPALEFDEENLQVLALECLTQCCLHKLETCFRYIYLFKKILDQNSDSFIEFITLKCLMDIYMIWDLNTLSEDDDEKMEVSHDSLFWNMIKYLSSSNYYIKALVIEGVTKLMLIGKISSPVVLAHLMIHYFDYNSESVIKQNLHFFFGKFSVLKDSHADYLCEAFKLFLEFFVYITLNPSSLALAAYDFKIKRTFAFILTCLSPVYLEFHCKFTPKVNYTLDLFYYISRKLAAGPSSSESELYSKLLSYISITDFSEMELVFIKSSLQKIPKESKTKYILNLIENITKKNMNYQSIDEIETLSIDRSIQTSSHLKKFMEKYFGKNFGYLTPQRGKDEDFNSNLKRNSTFPLGSDLRRGK